jgi:hypothetical protein
VHQSVQGTIGELQDNQEEQAQDRLTNPNEETINSIGQEIVQQDDKNFVQVEQWTRKQA